MDKCWWWMVGLVIASGAGAATPSPYAGEEQREIRALSAEQVEGLLAGKGMGYAKAAELNGYPGPKHVLELAEELDLSEAQRTATERIFAEMAAQARTLGAELVAAERALDQDFRHGQVTESSLQTSLAQIAQIQGKLRQTHLAAHLQQIGVLSAEQVTLYVKLRGYDAGAHDHHH